MQRREPFVTGEYYHIFNRGVEKRDIFSCSKDYSRFLDSIVDFNTNLSSWKIKDIKISQVEDRPRLEEFGEKLVEVIAYCLNPNHFHLILKQEKDGGIAVFMKKVLTGYAMYFNKKYDHSGVLFQGRFKSVLITSNEQLLYVSVYVNCNSEVHNIAPAKSYQWCSFGEYRGFGGGVNCKKEVVLGQFNENSDYEKYAFNQIGKIKENKEMKKAVLILE
jgi:putative transposase